MPAVQNSDPASQVILLPAPAPNLVAGKQWEFRLQRCKNQSYIQTRQVDHKWLHTVAINKNQCQQFHNAICRLIADVAPGLDTRGTCCFNAELPHQGFDDLKQDFIRRKQALLRRVWAAEDAGEPLQLWSPPEP